MVVNYCDGNETVIKNLVNFTRSPPLQIVSGKNNFLKDFVTELVCSMLVKL